jgi:hypothetical protein
MTSYPIAFYILDDGTWLILDPSVGGWFHLTTLLPVINGYHNNELLKPEELDELQRRSLGRCTIGFESWVDWEKQKI